MFLLLHVGIVALYIATGIQYALKEDEPTTTEETIKESPASN
jgi:hypothetical protein